MILRKGNTYKQLPILLALDNIEEVVKVEFTFGNITKNYPEEVSRDGDYFLIDFSQQDTFSLDDIFEYQARIMFKDGAVKSTPVYTGATYRTLSKEVLQ